MFKLGSSAVKAFRTRRPSPAMVVALAALIAGGTGSAVAAGTLGSPEARSSASVKSLAKKYAKKYAKRYARTYARQGPRGLQGPQGLAGIGRISSVDGPAGYQCADGGGGCQVASSTATCPSGSVAVGGGFNASSIDNAVEYAKRGPNTFGVIAINYASTPATITAQVVCASGNGVVAAGKRRVAMPRDMRQQLSRLRAALDTEGRN